jgi:hypothetical protein
VKKIYDRRGNPIGSKGFIVEQNKTTIEELLWKQIVGEELWRQIFHRSLRHKPNDNIIIDHYTEKRQLRIRLAQINYILDDKDNDIPKGGRILDLLGVEN